MVNVGCDVTAGVGEVCTVDGRITCEDTNADCVADSSLLGTYSCVCKVGYVAVRGSYLPGDNETSLFPRNPRRPICRKFSSCLTSRQIRGQN